MRISLIACNARYTHSCLALFYIRNELYARFPEAEVALHQYTINDPYYELLMRIAAEDVEYYFFSAVIWNSDLLCHLLDDLLRICPRTRVVIGGPQAEVVGRALEQNGAAGRFSLVFGEIERISEQFYEHLGAGNLVQSYFCQEKRQGFSFPYTEEDLAGPLRHRHIYYESSRGCPFSCCYCLSAANKGVYHKDLALVQKELSLILAHNPGELRFIDRTFNDNKSRALAIWKFLLDQDCDTRFHFEISPDLFSDEMLCFLETIPVGRFEFEIGIQSTTECTLNAIGRPISPLRASQVVSRLVGLATIHLHVDLILGLPYETEDTFLSSFRDVFAMGPHYIQMGLLKVLPNTPLYADVEQYGIVYSNDPPYPILMNRWLSPEVLRDLFWFGEVVERFVNNRYFVSLWQYVRFETMDPVVLFRSVQKECVRVDFFRRATTQELLTEILLKVFSGQAAYSMVSELLRYDWLRCGHKFLPTCLVREEEDFRNNKRKVFQFLAEDSLLSEPPYDTSLLSYCFKRGLFVSFAKPSLLRLGYECPEEGEHFLCFLPDRDATLQQHTKVVLFPGVRGGKRIK